MPLTNTVKELEENLDFGIQKLIKSEPGLILVNNDNEKHLDDVDGDADYFWRSVGSVQQRKQTKVHKNWKKWENKAVLVSV